VLARVMVVSSQRVPPVHAPRGTGSAW
jgi:hypothetical protein